MSQPKPSQDPQQGARGPAQSPATRTMEAALEERITRQRIDQAGPQTPVGENTSGVGEQPSHTTQTPASVSPSAAPPASPLDQVKALLAGSSALTGNRTADVTGISGAVRRTLGSILQFLTGSKGPEIYEGLSKAERSQLWRLILLDGETEGPERFLSSLAVGLGASRRVQSAIADLESALRALSSDAPPEAIKRISESYAQIFGPASHLFERLQGHQSQLREIGQQGHSADPNLSELPPKKDKT